MLISRAPVSSTARPKDLPGRALPGAAGLVLVVLTCLAANHERLLFPVRLAALNGLSAFGLIGISRKAAHNYSTNSNE